MNTTAYSDKELFTLIANGDEAAFEALFHRYVPKIRPVLLGMVQSEAVAQDLVQDIFLSIWVNRYKLADIEEPANWIYKIVYNRSYTLLEKQAVRRKAHEQIGAVQPPATSAVQAEDTVLYAETARLVQEAIYALPPQTKKIYQLSREHGLKNQEIAEALELSVNTVKNTIVNACKAIKEHLEKKGISIPVVLILPLVKFFL